MNESVVLEIGRGALQVALMLSLPMLGVSLVLGTIIGVFQAATQIHEATLTFVPKLLAIFLVLAVLGPWMLQNLLQFSAKMFNMLPTLVHRRR
jgi:flagellar biosynthesis protein FliQ